MTFENRKARYNFFIKNNDIVRAEALSSKYPDVIEVVEVKEKPKKKEVKEDVAA